MISPRSSGEGMGVFLVASIFCLLVGGVNSASGHGHVSQISEFAFASSPGLLRTQDQMGARCSYQKPATAPESLMHRMARLPRPAAQGVLALQSVSGEMERATEMVENSVMSGHHNCKTLLRGRVVNTSKQERARTPSFTRFLWQGPLLSAAASVKIKAPMSDVWSKISDFEGMPQWMPWIHSVKTFPEGISKWTLRKRILKVPLQFSWTAKEGEQIPNRLIHWEAQTGLENRGKIELEDWTEGGDEFVRVTMTISYRMPTIVAKLFREDSKRANNKGVVNRTIEKILLSDLRRLKTDLEGAPVAQAAAVSEKA